VPLIEIIPVPLMFVLVAAVMLLSFETGYQFGKRSRTIGDGEAPAMSSMVAGSLGMLAFVLAFTFSIASSHHDTRRMLVLEEANAIGTAYLRADFLDYESREEVKRLLRDYVDLRVQKVTVDNYKTILARSEEIHDQLWAQVSSAAMTRPDTNTQLAVESINNVIDLHGKRAMAALFTRIPVTIWFALIVIPVFCMLTMGVQIGFAGKRRLIAVVPMLLAFTVLVTLVIDLDRPGSGMIKVSQRAMSDVHQRISGEAD
jgi:hypothetical protein